MYTPHQEPSSPNTSNPPNRRRTSSFNFFSSLTSSLRNSTSNPNSNASSMTNLPGVVTANDESINNNISSPGRSRATSSSSRLPPLSITQRTGSNNPSTSVINEDFYASTPTEDHALQTRTNSFPTPPVVHKPDSEGNYSIRLTPFIDHSTNVPALYFSPLLRKVKPNTKLLIGRYTDKVKESVNAPQTSTLPLVFKSKVVSRTHAEFYVNENGDWFIKDLKSSSGSFLNHMRLSPAGVESLDMQLSNGDVLQLGMDFRGGIEDIFRCVKMKVELNRSWQRKAKKFNKDIHQKFSKLALTEESQESSECAICLSDLKPCQSLFVSPCSHCWHYKCIRPILIKSYPQFLCPNCRETCDLEEDFDEEELTDDDDDDDDDEDEQEDSPESADTDEPQVESVESEGEIEEVENELVGPETNVETPSNDQNNDDKPGAIEQ